ncbi:MAG: DNA gyrase subunit A [Dehalococcoidales bacterium]|jgi:DNA gyrase subunit A|nr:DNA gyrase subunit A [Dehalococcoidales bacterium]MDP6737560.1 DNA gyrase subunit A [Dehalococcoidales bacterium]|tara:strand:- start:13706 stop:16144 length:2439 start_codon:yes stop_codon:yes gene_type:complete
MVVGKLRQVHIEDEMRSSYMDYAMSVIVSRALPDVRDGLKPVHRRILYAMNDMGITHNSAFKKSARVVGDVLGKYHPHGDASIYDAMVRMAQDFSLRYMLVDGQGNFGSVDDDPPAAMRYTEARLTAIAEQMLVDIDKETINLLPNFDASLQEPSVLPAQVPNLLVNGSSGIAVGMATNIPPHNLSEVCDALIHLIDDPSVTVDVLTQFVKGPDFPTAGIILGQEGIKSSYATGRGRIVVRAKTEITEVSESAHRQIIVTELPYQVNKAALVERIAELVTDKRITGINEVRDESDRQGMRIVIELKREAQPQQVQNNLYKYTAMQSAFNVNMLALVEGQPRVLSLKEALQYFVDFRREVVTRRAQFDLKVAKARAHILEGLKIALEQIDKVIATIRKAATVEVARQSLKDDFSLSQVQVQAILDMQLRRLANLERSKIFEEHTEVLKHIGYLESLLDDPRKVLLVIKNEVSGLKKKFGDSRRTEISAQGETEFNVEDLIPHQRVVVTLSQRGFVKRVLSQLYALQHRGGRGIVGMVTRDNDAVRLLVVADTHDSLLFFTNRGKVFRLKCYEILESSSRATKGIAVINLFPIAEGERVTDVVSMADLRPDVYLLMATSRGEIKKTALERFASVRSSGLIAMDVEEGDDLVAVRLATDQDEIMVVTEKGQSIRFPVSSLRASSRTSGGVRAMRLIEGDLLVSMDVADPNGFVLIVSANGFGKLTRVANYPLQKRGGIGVRTFKIMEKTGDVATARVVSLSQQVMIISADGIIIRTPVKERDPKKGITVQGRSTAGVKLMRLGAGDKAVAITAFD